MTELGARMEQARNDVAAATARVNELAALIPEPVASVAEAIMSLTPAQRAALWASRTEAMELVAQHRAEVQEQLDRLTAHGNELRAEWHDVEAKQDFARLSEIAKWFKEHDDEVGQLKTMIRELDALYAEFEANPVAPAVEPPTAR